MLPKEVLELVRAERVAVHWETALSAEPADSDVHALFSWLISPRTRQIPVVRRYLFYLKWMYETFHAIAECFPPQNIGREGQKDSCAMATSPLEMLYLANHLYILNSYGVEGAVLECGCFKGFSSCCLSHACAFLSRDLIVADSFEGLPSPGLGEVGYYQPGDFAGTLEEVQSNIQTFGRPECVQYLKGWFTDSLKGWQRPLALLWTDVDLYQSTLDVLENTFTTVDPRGAVFSHEFIAKYFSAGQIIFAQETPGAYRDFFKARGITYYARHATNYTGMMTFPSSEAPASPRLLDSVITFVRDSDHRLRQLTPPLQSGSTLSKYMGRLRALLAGMR